MNCVRNKNVHKQLAQMSLRILLLTLLRSFNFFPTREQQTRAKGTRKEQAALPNDHGNYVYPAISSNYPYPPMGPPPFPSMMYPVPMIPVHPGYASWFAPTLGYGAANNGLPDGAHYGRR